MGSWTALFPLISSAISLAALIGSMFAFIWAIKTNQAVVVTRLESLEKTLLNGGNGVVQRLDKAEQKIAAVEARCEERHLLRARGTQ